MYIQLINILLAVISFSLVIFLLFRLITWWNKYKAWLDSIEQSTKQRESKVVTRGFAQGIQIPNLPLHNPLDASFIHLHDLVNKGCTLVFMDKSCLHCNINFEEFFNNSKKDNYYVIFKKQDTEKAKELLTIYNNAFNVYLVDQSIYKTLKLQFMPAFVKINKHFIAENATPVPFKAINHF